MTSARNNQFTRVFVISAIVLSSLIAVYAFPQNAHAYTGCPAGWTQKNVYPTTWLCQAPNNGPVYKIPNDEVAKARGMNNCPAGSVGAEDTGIGKPTCVDANTGKDLGAQPGMSNASGTGTNTQQQTPNVIACTEASGTLSPLDYSFKCTLVNFLIFTFAAVLTALGYILYAIDALFNLVINSTVLEFGKLYGYLSTPLNTLWSVGRDLANILIIGLFVYIAISFILGLEQFGQKKFVARVLIIAVLINFSFLFTRIIINTSNAFAIGIYNAGRQTEAANGTKGPGDQFLALLKVGTWQDTSNSLSNMYKQQDLGLGGAIVHTIVSFILIIGASLTLLYGTVLLVARFIVLVFLLIVSCLAFASWLLPGYAESEHGWKGWWKSLLKNALLAPLMMFAVTASLLLGQGLAKDEALRGSIGKLSDLSSIYANKSIDPQAIAALFYYLLIVGILFTGMYISANISFAWSRRLAGSVTGRTVGLGAGAAAWSLRNTVGAGAQWAGQQRFARDLMKLPFLGRPVSAALFGAGQRSFDARNIKGVETATKKLGLDVGKGFKGGFQDAQTAAAKKLQEREFKKAEFFGSPTGAEQRGKAKDERLAEETRKVRGEIAKQREDAKADRASIERAVTEPAKEMKAKLQREIEGHERAAAEADRAAGNNTAGDSERSQAARKRADMLREEDKIQRVASETHTGVNIRSWLSGASKGRLARLQAKIDRKEARVQKLNASVKQYDSDIKERKLDYARDIGNKRFFSLMGSKTRAWQVRQKVVKDVGKSKEEREAEKFRQKVLGLDESHTPPPAAPSGGTPGGTPPAPHS